MEAHRTFREEVEGDGVPEEPPRPRAVLHAAKGFEAESAPKFHSGADESQTAGNAEDRRWVSDGGESTCLRSLAPRQVPGHGAAAPIDPPTRLVSTNESPPRGTAHWTGLYASGRTIGPSLRFVLQLPTLEEGRRRSRARGASGN